nr:MAG TPA: hypothetical protein [Caudoviricetes sp.]
MTKKSGQLASKGILAGFRWIFAVLEPKSGRTLKVPLSKWMEVCYTGNTTQFHIFISLRGKCFGKRCFLSYSLCP